MSRESGIFIFLALAFLLILSFATVPTAHAQLKALQSSDCKTVGINCSSGDNVGTLRNYALNVLNIGLSLLGVVALIMVCVGGIRYITARGDEGDTEKAKRTIMFAVIGLVVVGLAAVIVNFTLNAAGVAGGVPGGSNLIGKALITLNIFLTLVGMTALVYVILGGVRYITAQGEEGKIEEAKKMIIYAVIGLVVVGLAAIIVNFTAAAVGLPTGIPASNNLPLAVLRVINYALIFAGLTALIFVILGGVRYITSFGEADKAEEGKKTILYAVIGLIVIGLAAVLVNFIISAFFFG